MSKKSRFGTVLGLAVVLVAPLMTLAQGQGGRGGPAGDGPRHPMGKILQQLELSQEQQDQIRGLLEGEREARQGDMQRLREARAKLREQIQAVQLDEAAIRAAAASVGRLEADAAVNRARVLGQVRSLLTVEQLTKFNELLAQAPRDRRGRGPGPHGPHGRGGAEQRDL